MGNPAHQQGYTTKAATRSVQSDQSDPRERYPPTKPSRLPCFSGLATNQQAVAPPGSPSLTADFKRSSLAALFL